MSQTRYCSTCGTLLSEGAAICGECGARYQASPYERRATDAPGAWSQAPAPRVRDRGARQEQETEDEGIELISRESLTPTAPGATALRTSQQYDQLMVTQPPMHQSGPGSAPGLPSGPGSPVPAPAPDAPATGAPMDPPLDGCTPAAPLKRFLAALIDAVIGTLVTVPLFIGGLLTASATLNEEELGLLPPILFGVGVALVVAYVLLIIWLVGAKGFSLGKLILGLRVADTVKGGSIGVLRSLGRWILYGLIPLIMALSIFIDPKKQLRGFHDRAIGSVVVDVNAGRNPLKKRPDDFERAGAEHYLGESSVAVSAHQNLLAEPGAAWKNEAASAPAQPAASAGWGADQELAPSPYAPASSASAAPQGPDDGWAPPPVDPVPSPQPSWGQSAPQQDWNQPAPQPPQPWDQPAAPPVRSWDQPAAQQPQQSWGQPASEQYAPPQQPPQQPWDQQQAPESTAPSDLTADAWHAGAGVDEQTRMSLPEDPLADLEQTRISPLRLPAVKKLRLTTDDGAERVVERAVVVGRNPSAPGEEVLFVLKDDTRSVSKTHLVIDGTGDEVTVTDLGSTNGSTILREDGSRENLVPNSPTVLPTGAQVTMGDRTLSVEREQ